MARRAHCRCGYKLQVRRGPDGYKTRCPNCRANVRVRRPGKLRSGQPKPVTTCPCGAVVVLDAKVRACPCCGNALAAPAPVPELAGTAARDAVKPPRILDLFEEHHTEARRTPRARVSRAVACDCCGEEVPADAGCCLWCGAPRPDASPADEPATRPLQFSLFRRMLGLLLRK